MVHFDQFGLWGAKCSKHHSQRGQRQKDIDKLSFFEVAHRKTHGLRRERKSEKREERKEKREKREKRKERRETREKREDRREKREKGS